MRTRYEKAKVTYRLRGFPHYLLDYPGLAPELKSRDRGTTWTFRFRQKGGSLSLAVGPGYLIQLRDRDSGSGRARVGRYAAARFRALREALVQDIDSLSVWVRHLQAVPSLEKMRNYGADQEPDLTFLRTLADAEIQLLRAYKVRAEK